MPVKLSSPTQVGPQIAEHKAIGIVITTPWDGEDAVDVRYSARDSEGNVVATETVRLPMAELAADPDFAKVYGWLKKMAYKYDPYPAGSLE